MKLSQINVDQLPELPRCYCGGERTLVFGPGAQSVFVQCLKCRSVTDAPDPCPGVMKG